MAKGVNAVAMRVRRMATAAGAMDLAVNSASTVASFADGLTATTMIGVAVEGAMRRSEPEFRLGTCPRLANAGPGIRGDPQGISPRHTAADNKGCCGPGTARVRARYQASPALSAPTGRASHSRPHGRFFFSPAWKRSYSGGRCGMSRPAASSPDRRAGNRESRARRLRAAYASTTKWAKRKPVAESGAVVALGGRPTSLKAEGMFLTSRPRLLVQSGSQLPSASFISSTAMFMGEDDAECGHSGQSVMGFCPQSAALCWAIGLGVAATLLACAALALVV